MVQAEAVDQLQLENRELRGLQERLGRKERRARDLKKKNASLGEQHTALLEDYEACQEQASCVLCTYDISARLSALFVIGENTFMLTWYPPLDRNVRSYGVNSSTDMVELYPVR